jgi:predicted nucleic acid-binding protein
VSAPKKVVLDANILVRAAFGRQVQAVLKKHEEAAEFYSPDNCIEEARRNIASISAGRRISPVFAESMFEAIVDNLLLVVDRSLYEPFEEQARQRIAQRDPEDWPVVATALLLDAPIWTEDKDFFGIGIATWTTDRIELYLSGA